MSHCLKFPNEQTAIDLMPQYRIDDQWKTASHSHALDPIGPLPETEGWHMNFQGELPETCAAFIVEPLSQRRVWA